MIRGSARARWTTAAVLVAASLLGGCAAADEAAPEPERAGDAGGGQAEPALVLKGEAIGEDGRRTGRVAASATDARTTGRPRTRIEAPEVTRRTWTQPALDDDGTIDDGPDPFEGERVQVQPVPIEDDPETTAAIEAEATRIRRVEREQWDRWMGGGAGRSPWQQGDDPFAASLVKVSVERCGGARTVATGVVLADETVVTTVHAVESTSRRVRVSPASGGGARIPAMVRYLDVDDDIAVLKVPGLTLRPMPYHVPNGTEARFGFAYGVGQGGVAGVLRRNPVVVSMQERTVELEQPDGFSEQISDRSVQTLVGGIASGFSGGVVAVTNDPALRTGFGFQGLVRARVPFRADTGGIVVPSRLVGDAIDASEQFDEWFEHRPGDCPQWQR